VNREHGATVLIVTHNHALAGQCDRIVELVDGRLVADRRVDPRQSAAAAPA
jgi:predicted ABC-type transport system involved in lysophospholipase L1 biosynthesis ATPase subunit